MFLRAGRKRILSVVRHNDGKMEKYCIMMNFIVCKTTLSLIEKKLKRERKSWTIK
jgi:hypothetical protein